jgi:hypothetical protein
MKISLGTRPRYGPAIKRNRLMPGKPVCCDVYLGSERALDGKTGTPHVPEGMANGPWFDPEKCNVPNRLA